MHGVGLNLNQQRLLYTHSTFSKKMASIISSNIIIYIGNEKENDLSQTNEEKYDCLNTLSHMLEHGI